MVKVAYNACYGGFGLSREAVLRAREISGNPHWGDPCIQGDLFESGEVCPSNYGHIDYEIPRHDPVLIQVIQELGEKANGMCAKLAIEEIPVGTPYRIDEYDGNETVMLQDMYDWVMP